MRFFLFISWALFSLGQKLIGALQSVCISAEIPQFSQQERERVAELQEIIDRPGISTNQRQIAEANLQALYESKGEHLESYFNGLPS